MTAMDPRLVVEALDRSRDHRLAAWPMVRPDLRSRMRAGRGGRVDAPGKGRPEIWPGDWYGTGRARPAHRAGHRPVKPSVRMVTWVRAGRRLVIAGLPALRRWPCLVAVPIHLSWSLRCRGAGTAAHVRVRA
jgi:hypothetical protein